MNIVVAVRCYNEQKNIERFMRCYAFADHIVVSDGGSTDDSVSMLQTYPKVSLVHYEHHEIVSGYRWNPDAMHMNYVIDRAKEFEPDWLILDDMDDVPTKSLMENARSLLEKADKPQVNAFRLYIWGEDQYFPFMNRDFDPKYKSLWAWKPQEINIMADISVRHGTIMNTMTDPYGLDIPNCLLHYSWNPETIQQKIDRYNGLGLPMNHPSEFAGSAQKLPEWAVTG